MQFAILTCSNFNFCSICTLSLLAWLMKIEHPSEDCICQQGTGGGGPVLQQ